MQDGEERKPIRIEYGKLSKDGIPEGWVLPDGTQYRKRKYNSKHEEYLRGIYSDLGITGEEKWLYAIAVKRFLYLGYVRKEKRVLLMTSTKITTEQIISVFNWLILTLPGGITKYKLDIYWFDYIFEQNRITELILNEKESLQKMVNIINNKLKENQTRNKQGNNKKRSKGIKKEEELKGMRRWIEKEMSRIEYGTCGKKNGVDR